MWGYLSDTLTDDEHAIVVAKLLSAELQAEKVRNELEDFIDGLDEDVPFLQRIQVAAGSLKESGEWSEALAVSRAIRRAGDASDNMLEFKRELQALRTDM